MAQLLEDFNSSSELTATGGSWNTPPGLSNSSTDDLWTNQRPLSCLMSESADSYISCPRGKSHDRFKAKPEELPSRRSSSLGNADSLSPTKPNDTNDTTPNFTITPLMSPPLVVDQIAPEEDSSEDRMSPGNKSEGRSKGHTHLATEGMGSIPSSQNDELLDATESALQVEDDEDGALGPKFTLPMAGASVNDRSLSHLELGTYFEGNSPVKPSKWSDLTNNVVQDDETGEPAPLPPAFDPQFDFEDYHLNGKEPDRAIQWNTTLYAIARGFVLLGLLFSPMICFQCYLALPKYSSSTRNSVQSTLRVDTGNLTESDNTMRNENAINVSEKSIHHRASFSKSMVLRDSGRIKAFAPYPLQSYIQISNLMTSFSPRELSSVSEIHDVKRSMIGSWGRSLSKILLSVRLLLLLPFATPVYLATLSLYPWINRILRHLTNERTRPPTTPMEAIL